MMRGVLLAAGSSTRFGSDKLLHPLDESITVIEAAARNLVAALPRSVAVVRPDSAEITRRLRRLGLDVVICEHAARGMGASIAAGVAATSSAGGWIIALGDMPWVQSATILQLVGAVRAAGQIGVPRYRGARGNPAAFGAGWRDALLRIDGDHGARHIIEEHAECVVWVRVDDSGVCRDIDRPSDIVGNVLT